MTYLEAAGVASTAMRAHLARSILTALGIVIGVGAMVAMVAIGDGAMLRVAEQMRAFGTDLLLVLPGSSERDGIRLGTGSRPSLVIEDAGLIENRVRGVEAAAPAVTGRVQVVHGNRNWATLVGGVGADYLAVRAWSVARGRPFSHAEDSGAAKVALVGATVREHLFEDDDPLGQVIRIGGAPFTVVGELASRGQDPSSGRDQDDVVLVPLSAAKLRLFGSQHRRAVDLILVKVEEDAAPGFEARIRDVLRMSHALPSRAEDDFVIRDPTAALEARGSSIRSLTHLLLAVAAISLMVGGISVMNIMLVAAAERQREIGLRLALGARPTDICRQFLFEALLICLVGAAAGVVAGAATAAVVAALTGWPVAIRLEAVMVAVGSASLVGLIFGLYPARRAARLDPAVALRAY